MKIYKKIMNDTGCSRKDRPCDLHTADPGADCGKRIFP